MSEFFEPLDTPEKWQKRSEELGLLEEPGIAEDLASADERIRSLGFARLMTEHGERVRQRLEQQGEYND